MNIWVSSDPNENQLQSVFKKNKEVWKYEKNLIYSCYSFEVDMTFTLHWPWDDLDIWASFSKLQEYIKIIWIMMFIFFILTLIK